jgi:hypothetical protein
MFNLFLQLCLAALCSAAPITAQDATTQYGAGGGVIGFIVLVLDILVWSKSHSYYTLSNAQPANFPVQSRSSSHPAPLATSSSGLSSSSSSPSAVSSSTGCSPTARSGTTETATRLLSRRRGRNVAEVARGAREMERRCAMGQGSKPRGRMAL